MTEATANATLGAPAQSPAALFCGTYRHTVDPKGRVAVPAQLRRGLVDGSVVAPGPDGRLMIWPPDAWQAEEQEYVRFAETPSQQRDLLRMLRGSTYPLELDAQGRMLLTAPQRAFAAIADSVVFVGMGGGIEVCGEARAAGQSFLDPDEFTRLHDVVHRAGSGAAVSR